MFEIANNKNFSTIYHSIKAVGSSAQNSLANTIHSVSNNLNLPQHLNNTPNTNSLVENSSHDNQLESILSQGKHIQQQAMQLTDIQPSSNTNTPPKGKKGLFLNSLILAHTVKNQTNNLNEHSPQNTHIHPLRHSANTKQYEKNYHGIIPYQDDTLSVEEPQYSLKIHSPEYQDIKQNNQIYLYNLRLSLGKKHFNEKNYTDSLISKLGAENWPINFTHLKSKHEKIKRIAYTRIHKAENSLNQLQKKYDDENKKSSFSFFSPSQTINNYINNYSEKSRNFINTIVHEQKRLNDSINKLSLLDLLLHPDNPNFTSVWNVFLNNLYILYSKKYDLISFRKIYKQHLDSLETAGSIKTQKKIEVEKEKSITKIKKLKIELKNLNIEINSLEKSLVIEIKPYKEITEEKSKIRTNKLKLENNYLEPPPIILDKYLENSYSTLDNLILSKLEKFNIHLTLNDLKQTCYVSFNRDSILNLIAKTPPNNLVKLFYPEESKVNYLYFILMASKNLNNKIHNSNDKEKYTDSIFNPDNYMPFVEKLSLTKILLGEADRIEKLGFFDTTIIKNINFENNTFINDNLLNFLNDRNQRLNIADAIMSDIETTALKTLNNSKLVDKFKIAVNSIITRIIEDSHNEILKKPKIFQHIANSFISGTIQPKIVTFKNKTVPGLVFLGGDEIGLLFSLQKNSLLFITPVSSNKKLEQEIYNQLSEKEQKTTPPEDIMNEIFTDGRLNQKWDHRISHSQLNQNIKFEESHENDVYYEIFKANIDKCLSNLNGIIYTSTEKEKKLTNELYKMLIQTFESILILATLGEATPLVILNELILTNTLNAGNIYLGQQLVNNADRGIDLKQAEEDLRNDKLLLGLNLVPAAKSVTRLTSKKTSSFLKKTSASTRKPLKVLPVIQDNNKAMLDIVKNLPNIKNSPKWYTNKNILSKELSAEGVVFKDPLDPSRIIKLYRKTEKEDIANNNAYAFKHLYHDDKTTVIHLEGINGGNYVAVNMPKIKGETLADIINNQRENEIITISERFTHKDIIHELVAKMQDTKINGRDLNIGNCMFDINKKAFNLIDFDYATVAKPVSDAHYNTMYKSLHSAIRRNFFDAVINRFPKGSNQQTKINNAMKIMDQRFDILVNAKANNYRATVEAHLAAN